MTFTPEQRKAWRTRPAVKARQREHERALSRKRKALGLPAGCPIDRAKRSEWIVKSALRRAEGEARLRAHYEMLKAEVAAYKKSPQGAAAAAARRRKATETGRVARAIQKARALTIFGNKCEWCDCDLHDVLQFHHLTPVKRSRKIHQIESSDRTHRKIVKGELTTKHLKLLCANCHIIASRYHVLVGSGDSGSKM